MKKKKILQKKKSLNLVSDFCVCCTNNLSGFVSCRLHLVIAFKFLTSSRVYFRLCEACESTVSPLNYFQLVDTSCIYHMTLKMNTSSYFSMGNRPLIHVDLLAMNVSWTPKDLELFENEFDFLVSMVLSSLYLWQCRYR